jgi:hypothetical protein
MDLSRIYYQFHSFMIFPHIFSTSLTILLQFWLIFLTVAEVLKISIGFKFGKEPILHVLQELPKIAIFRPSETRILSLNLHFYSSPLQPNKSHSSPSQTTLVQR